MPTSTQSFEVLFEFTNDTAEPATLEPLQGGQNGTTSIGRIVLLHEKESISLVLNAGSTYHYLFKRLGYGFEAEISYVKFIRMPVGSLLILAR